MAGQAKEQRDEWEVKLVNSIEELNIVTETEPVNKRVIIGKVKKVESTFEKLEKAHSQYCQKAKIGLRSSDSTEYLRGLVKLKLVSLSAAEEALGENSEEAEAKESLSKLEGELLKLSIDIPGTIAHLATLSTTALLTREQYGGSMDMLGEIKSMLERYMECAAEIQEC